METLEQEITLEAFKRYLNANSANAREIAVEAFEDFLNQRSAYAVLQHQHQQALERLRIHAADDAVARLLLQSQL